tara:strand:- start:30509 stop:31354 length:846 start_codon:yes stop_codon:yes gene_type:complete
MKVGSLFAGIGGIDLGLERAGMETVWQVEKDSFCRKVLAKHWPNARRYEDVKQVDWTGVEPVDVVSAGFPCQPASNAGLRLGERDERWLWPEVERCIKATKPRWVLLENVAALCRRGGPTVMRGLDALGYDAWWSVIPASAVGAPHFRARIFIVATLADANGVTDAPLRGQCSSVSREDSCGRDDAPRGSDDAERWQEPLRGPVQGSSLGLEPFAKAREGLREFRGSVGASQWAFEPGIRRALDGLPTRMDKDRLKALGNAVVPQVAHFLGRLIVECDQEK